ncbi:MAG: SIMPL domain-containing protein [Parvibaculaceae bacterium]
MCSALAPWNANAGVIQVSGTGTVRAKPDLALVRVGVESKASTIQEALERNNRAMRALLARIQELGIAKEDVFTSQFSVGETTRYDKETSEQVPTGFSASNEVTLTIRKVGNTGNILNQLSSAEASRIGGLEFTFSNPESLLNQARLRALKDAKRKAEVYARGMSVKLGAITDVVEVRSYVPTEGALYGSADLLAPGDGTAPVPVSDGARALSVDATVTFQTKE